MAVTTPSDITPLLNDFPTSNHKQSIRNVSQKDGYGTIEDDGKAGLETDDNFKETWIIEAKSLARNAAPLILTYMSQYSYNVVMVYIAGILGTKEQAAASLGIMTANITGICIYEGLATSLDTFTSQAYGAGKKELVGTHVQRMYAIMLVATIPIGVVWFSSPWILAKIVTEPGIAELAGTYMRYYLIGAPGFALFEAGKRFTQAQGNFTACLMVVMFCAPLNILWNWLFVFRLGLGFKGTALAAALSNNLQPLILILYINVFARHLLVCWPGASLKRAFQNWGQMVQLGLPGVFMIVSEWLAFEILTIASIYVSTEALAAQSVLVSMAVIMYHIPNPAAIAASTRFGNLIGRGSLPAARKAVMVYYTIFVGIGIFDSVLLISLRTTIANNLTHDNIVRDLILSTIPLVAIAETFNALSCISNGMLRGLGRQKIGGLINLGAYYVWAVPLSMFLALGPPKLGLPGLWVGPLSGLVIVTFTNSTYLRLSNWQKALDEARARDS